ncbi:MAG: DUF3365 domain-containing protein [Desulfobulbaceae bacterium]|nr:DUF3365 domain-containing protein [Desulfobulbaceae bacterium]
MMKKLSTIFLAAALAFTGSQAFGNEATTSNLDLSRQVIKELGATLKGELVQAMKAGGPVEAISVCKEQAPGIAKTLGEKHNIHIGRTSLKTRNPQNQPDEWEAKVLASFEDRKGKGEEAAKLDFSEVVTENGKEYFRYMKAIPTGPVCLKCHGATIKPEVTTKLDASYPEDKARGFKVGDLRGAFTVKKQL